MTLKLRWDSQARPQKEQVRTALVKGQGLRRSALFLPGNACLCVKEAIANGVIGPDTLVHAVERDPATAKVIDKTLRRLGLDYVLHVGDLSDYKPEVPLDYAMIDLMGPPDESLARWLRQTARDASAGFSLAVVVPMNWRHSGFMIQTTRCLQTNYPDLIRKLKEEVEIPFRYVLGYMAVLRCILNEFDFDFQWTIRYKDTRNTMLAYRLTNLHPNWTGSGWPSIEELVTEEIDMTDRSEAARKAWRTRRAQAISPRSAAALKAWETRRANGWVHPSKAA